jgi:hypothetical protein
MSTRYTISLLEKAQTFTGNKTFGGRMIVPMGETSYFNTTGTNITISAISDGSTNMVLVNPVTSVTGTSYEFTDSNGRLTYTGSITKMFHTALTISFSPATTNEEFVVGLAKNGTVQPGKILQKVANTSDIQAFSFHVMVELATNDYIEVYVGNVSSTGDFVVKTLNIFAMGM